MKRLTLRESTAAYMMSIHPLKVACGEREKMSLIYGIYRYVFSRFDCGEIFCEFSESAPHHLKQRQISGTDVVEVDLDVFPAGAVINQSQALRLIVHHADGKELVRGGVDAVVVLAGEQVDAHDAEDEPEDQTHKQHVHDGGDGAEQSVHYDLP